MPAPLESLTVDAHGLALHVRQRHPAGRPAVVFLHGWLDHSHSFDALAEHLPEAWRLVLLDLRGMGRSAWGPRGGHYQFGDHLVDVEAVVRGLGLERVYLVGHSLGGIIATAYAAARPERVLGLSLIESLGPRAGDAGLAPERLRGFLEDLEREPHRKRYPSVEAAAARLRENNPGLPEAAALHLARHGTEPWEGELAFTFDPTHRRRFAQAFDEAQWLALSSSVQCPVQVILGAEGLRMVDEARAQARLAALPGHPAPRVLPGGHHLHMECPQQVARALEEFLARAL